MVIRRFLNAEVKRVVVVLFLNFEFKVRVSHIKVRINRKKNVQCLYIFIASRHIQSVPACHNFYVHINCIYQQRACLVFNPQAAIVHLGIHFANSTFPFSRNLRLNRRRDII